MSRTTLGSPPSWCGCRSVSKTCATYSPTSMMRSRWPTDMRPGRRKHSAHDELQPQRGPGGTQFRGRLLSRRGFLPRSRRGAAIADAALCDVWRAECGLCQRYFCCARALRLGAGGGLVAAAVLGWRLSASRRLLRDGHQHARVLLRLDRAWFDRPGDRPPLWTEFSAG